MMWNSIRLSNWFKTNPSGALHPFHRMLWQSSLGLLFPVFCSACGARVIERVLPLCTPCLRSMPRADADAIRAQFDRLPAEAGRPDSIFAMWAFVKEGAIQHLQHALKYGNRPLYGYELGRLLAPALADHLRSQITEFRIDAIVPVPLHPARRLERGYNQSQHLAEGIAAGLALPPPISLLRRGRRTRTQTTLGVAARWENVAGAFETASTPPGAQNTALLVDDVLTTGATASAAVAALRNAGIQNVYLATLAFAAP
jgi:predicted amidophosphoribosyltransferase